MHMAVDPAKYACTTCRPENTHCWIWLKALRQAWLGKACLGCRGSPWDGSDGAAVGATKTASRGVDVSSNILCAYIFCICKQCM